VSSATTRPDTWLRAPAPPFTAVFDRLPFTTIPLDSPAARWPPPARSARGWRRSRSRRGTGRAARSRSWAARRGRAGSPDWGRPPSRDHPGRVIGFTEPAFQCDGIRHIRTPERPVGATARNRRSNATESGTSERRNAPWDAADHPGGSGGRWRPGRRSTPAGGPSRPTCRILPKAGPLGLTQTGDSPR
jgi:hypothetical protein